MFVRFKLMMPPHVLFPSLFFLIVIWEGDVSLVEVILPLEEHDQIWKLVCTAVVVLFHIVTSI